MLATVFTVLSAGLAMVALTGAVLAGAPGPVPVGLVRVLSSLVVVRPRGTPLEGATAEARLSAAGGEWESFQVVVRAGPRGIAALAASASPMSGPSGDGSAAPTMRLARVAFVEVRTPSNEEGARGPWPDPLIPAQDDYAGEARAAFPARVAPGDDLTVWVDVWVPREAAPGSYRGEVRVRDGSHALAEVPVQLRVRRFVLPASSTVPVTFGFSAASAAHGLLGRAPSGDEALALARRFSLGALRHRVSLHGGTFEAPPCAPDGRGGVTVDFRRYDAEVGPLLDGSADPAGPARGARWSAFDLRAPDCPAPLREAGLGAAWQHLLRRGWQDRAFAYLSDEPTESRLGEVEQRAEALARVSPRVRRLVTTTPSPILGGVDLFCPPLYLVDPRPVPPASPLDGIRPLSATVARRTLWWYQSCLSHGCEGTGRGWFTGWPSLAIDAPPVGHRVLEWLAFAQGVGGELYYNTVEAWADGDPWIDALRHGGNGDGTLFYPGTPGRIGGHTAVPVESIRLRRIRDALEDYEYLSLLAGAGPVTRAFAEETARGLAPHAWQWSHDPAALLSARARLAERIEAGGQPRGAMRTSATSPK